jgi:hypothetical protein
MDNFDNLANFTPQAATTPLSSTQMDFLGLGNLISGGEIKHNRELERIILQNNLQHKNNFELTKWQSQWNKALDDTKAQRHMKDLQKAGINPILAHGQSLGGHASSGGASSGSSGLPGSGNGQASKLGKAIKMLATLILKSF